MIDHRGVEMRKSVLALAAASAVFALTAAGATGTLVLNEGLDSVFALPNSGAIDITQTQCTDAWTITYTQASPGDPITAVNATDTAATASALCGSATTATWSFGDGHAVNGTWASPVWTFDYSATAPSSPTASVGVGYTLISNAAAIAGNLTIGGSVATDPCPTLSVDPITAGVPSPAASPGVNWSGCDLRGAALNSANLTGANLSNADVTGAHLSYATLNLADLTGANLTNAVLGHADLTSVILHLADLTGAYLQFAVMTDADLTGATLTGATLSNAVMTNVDLTGANLTGTQFQQSDLTTATLTSVTYSNTTCPDGTNSTNHASTCTGHLVP